MFEARTWRTRTALQILATVLVVPYLFPLVVMVKGSLGSKMKTIVNALERRFPGSANNEAAG